MIASERARARQENKNKNKEEHEQNAFHARSDSIRFVVGCFYLL